jgi:hypothetical protein
MGRGLAVVKWPLLFADKPWVLADGTVECLLVAMSILALIGLRYPQRMLPILLFEVAWKLLWLGIVALPLWLDNQLEGATREQAAAVLWVGIIIAVIPWRHVLRTYRADARAAMASESVGPPAATTKRWPGWVIHRAGSAPWTLFQYAV